MSKDGINDDERYILRNGKRRKGSKGKSVDNSYSRGNDTDFIDFKKFTCDRLSELGTKIDGLFKRNGNGSDDYLIQETTNLRQQLESKEEQINDLKQRERFMQEEIASKNKIISMLTEDLVHKSSSSHAVDQQRSKPPIDPEKPSLHGNNAEWELVSRSNNRNTMTPTAPANAPHSRMMSHSRMMNGCLTGDQSRLLPVRDDLRAKIDSPRSHQKSLLETTPETKTALQA